MSQLFVITLPGPVRPLERTFRFSLPVDQALRAARLGSVTGEHTWVGRVEDGGFQIVGATLEVDLIRPEESLVLLRRVLADAGAPAETAISEACALCDGADIAPSESSAVDEWSCDRTVLPVRARWPEALPA